MQTYLGCVLDEEEFVAIRKEDWPSIDKAIDEAIKRAVEPLKPQGWRKALHLFREWGVVGTIATVIVALLALAATAFIQAFARVGKEATFEANTTIALEEIRGDLAGMKLKQLSSIPPSPQGAAQAKAILKTAEDGKAKIDASIIGDVGKKFVDAGISSLDSWSAALAFLDYRSYLNADFTPPLVDPLANNHPVTQYAWPKDPQLSIPVSYHFGKVPRDKAAVFEPLGQHLNTSPDGDAFLLMENGGAKIDGQDIKNVVFRNMVVEYLGGPLRMQNVYFVNCTFDFIQTPNSRDLGTALLAASPTKFSTPDGSSGTGAP